MAATRRHAYYALYDTPYSLWAVARATENEPGYSRFKAADSEEEARMMAKLCNDAIGLTPREADLIIASSMKAQRRDESHGIIERITEEFPGLLDDEDVNGGDLIARLSELLHARKL